MSYTTPASRAATQFGVTVYDIKKLISEKKINSVKIPHGKKHRNLVSLEEVKEAIEGSQISRKYTKRSQSWCFCNHCGVKLGSEVQQKFDEDEFLKCSDYLLMASIFNRHVWPRRSERVHEWIRLHQISDLQNKKAIDRGLCEYGLRLKSNFLVVANNHEKLDEIFRHTMWADGSWKRALGAGRQSQVFGVMAFGPYVRQRGVGFLV